VSIAKNILVVEDETDLAELIVFNLRREGYTCNQVGDGVSALQEIQRKPPSLVVLDRMLPGMSGDEVLAELKRTPKTASIPTIMLTAKADETDELVGFALGADDYISKPFNMKRLIARIGAVMRRIEAVDRKGDVVAAGPITLDDGRLEVTVEGSPVSLTATEFKMLRALMSARGRVLDREQLIDNVLGPTVAVTDRTIDVHIASLRKKLGSAAAWIQTIRGAGYTFRPPA
jgi:DNA-binding response OmpR family regulator